MILGCTLGYLVTSETIETQWTILHNFKSPLVVCDNITIMYRVWSLAKYTLLLSELSGRCFLKEWSLEEIISETTLKPRSLLLRVVLSTLKDPNFFEYCGHEIRKYSLHVWMLSCKVSVDNLSTIIGTSSSLTDFPKDASLAFHWVIEKLEATNAVWWGRYIS